MQDIEVIIHLGFFVQDIHCQLKQLHENMCQTESLIVYRGQGISNHEFVKIQASNGGLLSFNNFLSTSTDIQVARAFAYSAMDDPALTGVIFRMQIDPTIFSDPYASLHAVSFFSDMEEEILFSMHTVFRINGINQIENQLWQVNLTLTSDEDDQQLKRLTEYMRHETGGTTGWRRLGQLMLVLGKYELAENTYKMLLSERETQKCDDKDGLAFIHHQLGAIYDAKKDVERSLSHYQRSLDLRLSFLPPDSSLLAAAYNNIGVILLEQGNFDEALTHFQRVLEIHQLSSEPNHRQIAGTYNNIAGILQGQKKLADALANYLRCLDILRTYLPDTHQLLGTTCGNIGEIYYLMEDYNSALRYFEQALVIDQKSLPANHPLLALTHGHMALIWEKLDKRAEAIHYAQQAVDIARHNFEYDHPHLILFQQHLDQLLNQS
jgi:tetratricopeptide (TPR) repeat protein